jgi:hypothetical protein
MKDKRSSRRKFLWQMMSITGLTGFYRLTKAMAEGAQPSRFPSDPICVEPNEAITCNSDAYDCTSPGHDCTDDIGFICTADFDCGSWGNDFVCEDKFHCKPQQGNQFECSGGGPGPEFVCQGQSGEQDGYFVCQPYAQFTCSDFNCPQEFTCPQDYNCGDAFSDYTCTTQFTCNDFNCEAIADWGGSFYCENGFNCTNSVQTQPFWCDPGDFYCGPNNNQQGYQCNGQPGSNYTMPPQPICSTSVGTLQAYAVSITPPEP